MLFAELRGMRASSRCPAGLLFLYIYIYPLLHRRFLDRYRTGKYKDIRTIPSFGGLDIHSHLSDNGKHSKSALSSSNAQHYAPGAAA